MNAADPNPPRPIALRGLWLLSLLAFLLLLPALTWWLCRPATVPPVDQARVVERLKAAAELAAAEDQALRTYGWVDRSRGVVRLPISAAMALAVQEGRNPAQARSNLVKRVERATVPLHQPSNP